MKQKRSKSRTCHSHVVSRREGERGTAAAAAGKQARKIDGSDVYTQKTGSISNAGLIRRQRGYYDAPRGGGWEAKAKNARAAVVLQQPVMHGPRA